MPLIAAHAARVTSENLARGTERMGVNEHKAAALLDEAIYDPPRTADEKDAANVIVERTAGGRGAAGGRGGAARSCRST